MKSFIKTNLRLSLKTLSEGLNKSVKYQFLIDKVSAMGIDSEDIYYTDGTIKISVKLKYKPIILSVINKIENMLGWFLSGIISEDMDEPIESNVNAFKRDILYNLDAIENEGETDEDDEIVTLIFEPRFGEEILSKNLPDIAYHVTDENNLPRIKQQGLKPTHRDKITYHPDRIYLLSSKDKIQDLINNPNFNEGNPIVLTIDISSLKGRERFYMDPNLSDGGFYVLNNIPSNLIKGINKV